MLQTVYKQGSQVLFVVGDNRKEFGMLVIAMVQLVNRGIGILHSRDA
jgi:hypothetical protein